MSDCKHCKNGWFEGRRYGEDVECVNGVLIDIDVAHEGWQRDTLYPLAPCHPNFKKQTPNDSQERLAAWASWGSDADEKEEANG